GGCGDMNATTFNYNLKDAQAMPVTPVEPADFDLVRYEAFAAEADQRYADFLSQPDGVAVWQRVRVGEVFRDACRDMRESLRLQLGGLTKSLDYRTDAPAYLEPWYGIGTTASAFGGDYEWPEGQAPVVRPLYRSIHDVPPLVPRDFAEVPIMQYTLDTIEYFLDQTQGCVPLSWSDLQAPLNVATELIDTSAFFTAMVEAPDRVKDILAAMTEVVIQFTQKQSGLIGQRLARPGHGFASARTGQGIGLSTDNLVMISPRMYEKFCVADNVKIGAAFGGVAIHSCGDYARWLPALKKIDHLLMVDAAFSPQTDPNPNIPEAFRDAFVNTGVSVHARLVGDPDEVLTLAKRLWTPGLKLIVVTYVQDPIAQHQLYQSLHALCA
ncbi:MAG TPA: uroporphyrinogen decarboxylase family protein, partial [Anaerolineae bacterium]